MISYINTKDVLVITQPKYPVGRNLSPEIVFLVEEGKTVPSTHDRIAMGTEEGTGGKNAGWPVNVFYLLSEIISVGSATTAETEKINYLKVTAKVIRQEL